MAEQVNQRIEAMINELEQMRRTNLYSDEEIKEISRKRKELEYHLQRHVKQKEDYTQYITYELALLKDISIRRRKAKLMEKKKDIEFAIAKRLNRVFKQFIQRYQDDVMVYFEYLKFCKSVGFYQAACTVIGEMLQIHGNKPKMWQLASRWEAEEMNNTNAARSYLLRGLQRHGQSQALYLELFKLELLILTFVAQTKEEKQKQLKRADVIWRHSLKAIDDLEFLFELFELVLKYNVVGEIRDSIQERIWLRNNNKETWVYIASKELDGCHWKQIDKYVNNDPRFSHQLNCYIGVYEETLKQFPVQDICTKYIHDLLCAPASVCSDEEKVQAVDQAWMFGHENGLLSDDMYAFGIQLFKIHDMSDEQVLEILNKAIKRDPQLKSVWEQLILREKPDEKKMLSLLQDATNALEKIEDAAYLYNMMIDNLRTEGSLKTLHKQIKLCENPAVLTIKPKLLQKIYNCHGLKAARELYEDLIRSPPIQAEVDRVMITIEKVQKPPSIKKIRRCFEVAVLNHGRTNIKIWQEYMKFESEIGDVGLSSVIYRRAVSGLKPELVNEFIKTATLEKLNNK